MSEHDEVEVDFINPHKREQYDVNNKIMLTAIISLCVVVILVVILHLYARYLLRRQLRRRDILNRLSLAVTTPEPPCNGLDPTVIASLPIFPFKKTGTSVECVVCLSMLGHDELARSLPNCKHTFHAECIDRWLGSNSTCPICRSQVEPRLVADPPAVAHPSAPPMESANSNTSSSGLNSRLASFRRMLSRERSLHRVQDCGDDRALEDLERQ